MTNSTGCMSAKDDYKKMFLLFAEQSPDYADSDNQRYYEGLSPHEFHDAEELHEMRSQRRHITQANGDILPAVRMTGDIRQNIRVGRVGSSQAPPSWVLSVANDAAFLVGRAA